MMDKAKIKVCMIATSKNGNDHEPLSSLVKAQVASLVAVGVEVFFCGVDEGISARNILQNIHRLRKEIRDLRPNIIHAQYGSIISFITFLAKQDFPFIVSFAGSDLLGVPFCGLRRSIKDLLARLLGLYAASRAESIIVKSQNLMDALPSKLQKKANILPNGVDIDFFRPLPKDECYAKLKWHKKEKIILFFASTGYNHNQVIKNQKLACDAAKLLKKRNSNTKFLIIQQADKKEVSMMLNAADCLLVTSLHEGSPNLVKEAMACSLPVVSVSCGDVNERLRKVSPGGIYAYEADALAEGVQKVFEAGIRSNGRKELISQGLRAVDVAKILIEIYQRAQKQVFSSAG